MSVHGVDVCASVRGPRQYRRSVRARAVTLCQHCSRHRASSTGMMTNQSQRLRLDPRTSRESAPLRPKSRSASMDRWLIVPRRWAMLFAAPLSALGFGAVSAASATTGATEPIDSATVTATEVAESGARRWEVRRSRCRPRSQNSARPLAFKAAAASDDPEAMSSAFEAVAAAAPAELEATVEQVANGDEDAYGAMIEYMAGNCSSRDSRSRRRSTASTGSPRRSPPGPRSSTSRTSARRSTRSPSIASTTTSH